MARCVVCLACGLALAAIGGCETTPGGAQREAVAATLPAWLPLDAPVTRDAQLEEAAALLCARDTDGVIDADARRAAKLVDGQVLGMLRTGVDAAAARAALVQTLPALVRDQRLTHLGVVEGTGARACAAAVGVRRLVAAPSLPPSQLPAGSAISFEIDVPPQSDATLFLALPTGFVEQHPLPEGQKRTSLPARGGDGLYVMELVVTPQAPAPPEPELALLWPFTVGVAKEPPFPQVLFPDEGHSDLALTRRAEALVQRLRNEQLIEPLKIAPPLVTQAQTRAEAVASRGVLGHRVPGALAPDGTGFVRLSEVQAQASTLADAWQALLDSPAHRYVLVDTGVTHMGVAVVRGTDPAGRAQVTLLALLARRAPSRDVAVVRTQLLSRINAARDAQGLDALTDAATLDRLAMRLAERMRDTGQVDDGVLGAPIASMALEGDARFTRVRPLVARVDDPALLLQNGAPPAALEIDTQAIGFGMALDAAGVFYVCLLMAE